jgi:hypothetical protein
MTFTQEYPNLTWWFTCRYYLLHNGGSSITLYDQGNEVWDSGEMTDFDAVLAAAETWINAEYNDLHNPIGFENKRFSKKYPQLTGWFMQPYLSIHNRGDILFNLYDGTEEVWNSGDSTDFDTVLDAAEAWIKTAYTDKYS